MNEKIGTVGGGAIGPDLIGAWDGKIVFAGHHFQYVEDWKNARSNPADWLYPGEEPDEPFIVEER